VTFLELCKTVRQELGISGNGPSNVSSTIYQEKLLIDWVKAADLLVQRLHPDWDFLWASWSETTSAGTSTTAVDLETTGTCTVTNNVAMGSGHVKAIVDIMKERNIPMFQGSDYFCIAWPSTFRTLKNDLENVRQYVDQGFRMIMNGEIGRYEGVRFIEQTNIAKGGAADSTTWSATTADAWNNGKSDWAFFFGEDTVAEAIAVPEEIRGKIPTDYGRSKGIAWYALLGFGIVHTDADNSRIIKWDSAA